MATIDPTVRLTLGQMRRSAGRLAAAATAVVIGTAFVAATLLAGGIVTRTTYDQVAAQYADGDLVVFDRTGTLTSQDVATIRAVDGVSAADGLRGTYAELNRDGRTVYQALLGAPSDPRLSPLDLASGTWPDRAGQIALPVDAARLLGVDVGDTISSTRWLPGAKPVMDENGVDRDGGRAGTERLTVSGLVDDPLHAYAASGGVAVVTPAALEQRLAAEAAGPLPGLRTVVVALDRSDAAAVAAARDALAAAVPRATGITTPEAYAEDVVAGLADGQNIIFLVFVLALAGVSLVVAGLVIANTFQVLVAQRSRTLALLRCIGAGTGQVYRTVLLEAAAVGVVASAAGVLAGAALVQGGLLLAPLFDLGVALPPTVSLSVPVLLIPLGVGVLVTLLAALAPARAAARVAPVAALSPAVAPDLRARAAPARCSPGSPAQAGSRCWPPGSPSACPAVSTWDCSPRCSAVPCPWSASSSGPSSGCRGSRRRSATSWTSRAPRPGWPQPTRCATRAAPPRPPPRCSSASPSSP
nr:hypothetical protein GCM10025730_40550 [Promicromonospora thailandica]